MKKKNISYILFGVAAIDLLSALVSFFVLPRMYENLEIPRTPAIDRIGLIIGLISSFILIIVGVILRIKFRNEE